MQNNIKFKAKDLRVRLDLEKETLYISVVNPQKTEDNYYTEILIYNEREIKFKEVYSYPDNQLKHKNPEDRFLKCYSFLSVMKNLIGGEFNENTEFTLEELRVLEFELNRRYLNAFDSAYVVNKNNNSAESKDFDMLKNGDKLLCRHSYFSDIDRSYVEFVSLDNKHKFIIDSYNNTCYYVSEDGKVEEVANIYNVLNIISMYEIDGAEKVSEGAEMNLPCFTLEALEANKKVSGQPQPNIGN